MSSATSESAIPGVVGGLLAVGAIMAASIALVIILVMVVKRKQGRITIIEKGCSILENRSVCMHKVALLSVWVLGCLPDGSDGILYIILACTLVM
jgi:hypothetical protein